MKNKPYDMYWPYTTDPMKAFINRCKRVLQREKAIAAFMKPSETNSKPTDKN